MLRKLIFTKYIVTNLAVILSCDLIIMIINNNFNFERECVDHWLSTVLPLVTASYLKNTWYDRGPSTNLRWTKHKPVTLTRTWTNRVSNPCKLYWSFTRRSVTMWRSDWYGKAQTALFHTQHLCPYVTSAIDWNIVSYCWKTVVR